MYVDKGAAAGQQRWSADIRVERNPQEERGAELAPPREPHRRRSEPGRDGRDDATSDGEHDERSKRHGQSDGNDEPRARALPPPPPFPLLTPPLPFPRTHRSPS
jgi:hypothetical protein